MNEDYNQRKRYVVEEAGSVLIPKINLRESDSSQSQDRCVDEGSVNVFEKLMKNIRYLFSRKKNNRFDESVVGNETKKKGGVVKVLMFALIFVFVLLGIQSFLLFRVYGKGIALKKAGEKLIESFKLRDLSMVNSEMSNTKNRLTEFESSFGSVAWMKIIPYFGKFFDDTNHFIEAGKHGIDSLEVGLVAAEPYMDLIGFTNGEDSAGKSGETAQDRLNFIIKTLPSLVPRMDELAGKMDLFEKEISEIDPGDYPDNIAGYEVGATIRGVVEYSKTTSDIIRNAKPLLEISPYIMGVDEERTYLVIFQNDKELRPTGGFITAYSIAKVINGNFEPTASDDIYNLDNKYTPTLDAPQPIIDYIKGPYTLSSNLRLRDMNWSPDFSESMDLFSEEIRKAGIDEIDGIIAVDTQVLVNLLNVLGPIEVSGYGKFSTEIIPECNCPQVIYELESFADIEGPIVWSENEPGKIVYAPENYDNRKKIIGPLMNSVLSNTLGQPNEKIPALFDATIKSLFEKHVLFYLNEEKAQEAIEKFGIGGVIMHFDGDYLHINDANLGGRKSNLYVTQEVAQEISIDQNGEVTKILTITYKNPEKHDGWLNSVLPNWVRIYVPKGSELISIEGLDNKDEPYEEYGKTVFSGFFELRPQGVAKVVVKYKLPLRVRDLYSLYIQKQPGKDYSLYSFNINGNESEIYLRNDKEFNFKVKK